MQAHSISRDVAQRVIEHLDVQSDLFAKCRYVERLCAKMPPQRQIRTIDLQQQPRLRDGVVLVLHRVS
jgi:hypothetical protein